MNSATGSYRLAARPRCTPMWQKSRCCVQIPAGRCRNPDRRQRPLSLPRPVDAQVVQYARRTKDRYQPWHAYASGGGVSRNSDNPTYRLNLAKAKDAPGFLLFFRSAGDACTKGGIAK